MEITITHSGNMSTHLGNMSMRPVTLFCRIPSRGFIPMLKGEPMLAILDTTLREGKQPRG